MADHYSTMESTIKYPTMSTAPKGKAALAHSLLLILSLEAQTPYVFHVLKHINKILCYFFLNQPLPKCTVVCVYVKSQ